jgi:glycosyltransferase involved in cell wall biosynthesis
MTKIEPLTTSIIIPALNEAENIEAVILCAAQSNAQEILVIDGGSTDGTPAVSKAAGAKVIHEDRRGYGQACATGAEQAVGDILVFLDADGADDPGQINKLVAPILDNQADLVLGSRLAGQIMPGAMPLHQKFGNWLSAALIRLLYREPLTDLSPFRAIQKTSLQHLDMTEMTFGWPTEMICKSARMTLRIREIPVVYRPRTGGKSKISGTVLGTIKATYYILTTIIKYRLINLEKLQ